MDFSRDSSLHDLYTRTYYETLIPRVGFRTAHIFLSMHFTRLIKIVENFWVEIFLNNHDQLEIDLEFRTCPGKVQIEKTN